MLQLRFRGKSARHHAVQVNDARLARVVKRLEDLPGQLLFQYLDDDGEPRALQSSDVNAYLREATGVHEATAKTFRTWSATLFAAVALGGLPVPGTKREAQQALHILYELIARELGNTPAVARRAYIHPAIVESYRAGSMPEQWHAASARGSPALSSDERKLLHLLEQTADA